MQYRLCKNAPRHTVLISATAAAVVMLLIMQHLITFTYDDYYYSLFFQNGLRGFVEKNISHYLVRNGRVLVHIVAELLLSAGTTVYSIVNLLILIGIFFSFGRLLNNVNSHLLLWAFSAALVLCVDYPVLRSWLLCPADSANYMLPALLIGWMLLAKRSGQKRSALILALLCGATTELYAFVAFAFIFLDEAATWLRRGKPGKLGCVMLICILTGLATIFLSPATRQRAGSEFSVQGIGTSFVQYANSIAAPYTSLPVLTILCLLLGLDTSASSKFQRLGLPLSALLVGSCLLPRSTLLTSVVFFLFCVYLLICAVAMILTDQNRHCGIALITGLGTAAVMMFSSSCSIRVTIPFVLMMMVCSVHLLARLWMRITHRQKWIESAVALMLCGCLMMHIPTLIGIRENYRIMQENETAMATCTGNGIITYQEYEPHYCSQQLFASSDFQRVYLDLLDLEHCTVQYCYQLGETVTINGKPERILERSGRNYIPLRAVIEAAGGEIQVISDRFLEIRLNGSCWLYQSPRLYTPSGKVIYDADAFFSLENRYYICIDILIQQFGLDPQIWEG